MMTGGLLIISLEQWGAEYATPYNKFINFVWGWVMYVMYKLIPGPNWFIVIQEIIVLITFALFQYILSKHSNMSA